MSRVATSQEMASSVMESDETKNAVKKQLEKLITELSSVGLSVHFLQNKAVITKTLKDEYKLLDGEEALKFVNQPKHADKIVCLGQEQFYCHTEYLVQRSEYFNALLSSNFQENMMDYVSIELPAPGNFEPILRFLYSGRADISLFQGEEIFRVIQNSTFLGIGELLDRAVVAFAQKWKMLARLPLFKRSVVDSKFVGSVLEYGTRNGLFNDGDRLKLVILWNEEDESEFTESIRLIQKYKCLESASIVDLEWAFEAKQKLLSMIDPVNYRSVYRRTLRDFEQSREQNRKTEEKAKGLLNCVRILTTQLEDVRCHRCQLFMPRAALKTRTCVAMQHPGNYVVNRGWSCCGEFFKRTKGCKPVSVSRHRTFNTR